MRVHELLRHLEDDGWVDLRQPGDITQLGHPQRPGVMTVAGDTRLEVPPGTLRSAFPPAARARQERAS